MINADKLERIKKDLAARGISINSAVPSIWRVLWRIGIAVPPPKFIGFGACAILCGVPFGVTFGLVYWFENSSGSSIMSAVSCAVGTGIAYGILAAWHTRSAAEKLGVPLWKTYSES